jgi:hypothetical protein
MRKARRRLWLSVKFIALPLQSVTWNGRLRFTASDILGFRKTLDMPLGSSSLERLLRLRPGTTGRSVILQQGLSTIGEVELVQFSPAPSTPTPAKGVGGLGTFLLSFAVRDEELAAVYQRLLEQGIACYSEPQDVELPGYGAMRAVVVRLSILRRRLGWWGFKVCPLTWRPNMGSTG